MVTHSEGFRQYVKSQSTRLRTVVNNASSYDDGAPTGKTFFEEKKLNYKYKSIEKIKSSSRKINVSQDKAIVTAFNHFRGIKDSVFYERNLESNPTIKRAVFNNIRRNKDDDSDFNQPMSNYVNKARNLVALVSNSKISRRNLKGLPGDPVEAAGKSK